MVAAFVKIFYKGPIPGSPNLTPATMGRILRDGWRTLGEEWQEKDRPKHFTEEGAAEYGYVSRSSKYEAAKLRRKGHTRPLVWSGDLEEKSKAANIVATSEGVKVRLYWAQKANLRNPRSQIDMAQELRTVSDREVQEQCDLLGRTVRSKLLDIQSIFTRSMTGTTVAGYFHGLGD